MFKKIAIIYSLLLLGLTPVSAQQSYRFKGDVSVKEKLPDGTYRLTLGKIYYDKIYKKIVYDLKFPKKETVVIQDTTVYTIANNRVVNRTSTLMIPDFTVFHLALSGKLGNYGLENSSKEKSLYKIGKVEKVDNGVLTTWVPSEDRLKKAFGNIQMLKVDKRLDAMIFYDPKGSIISKQYFKQYKNVKGVEFPQQVTMIGYSKGKEILQQTNYKNIIIDQADEDEIYRYRIPASKSPK